MPVKNFVISFLIIISTVVGGTCFFGFCASADSGYIQEPEGLDRDIPIAEAIIKEDGKLEGKVLTIAKPEIDFGDNFSLVKNQKKVARIDNNKNNPLVPAKITVSVSKPDVKAIKDSQNNPEIENVLAEIKKQEKEVRDLLSELKILKETRELEQQAKSDKKFDEGVTVLAEKIARVDTKIKASADDQIPTVAVAKIESVQTEEKEIPVLMALKGGNIMSEKSKVADNIDFPNNQKKYQPMVVENTRKKPVIESLDSAFKDYSDDNSGRGGEVLVDSYSAETSGGFEKAFSALRPDKSKTVSNNIVAERRKNSVGKTGVSKEEVKSFRNAYLSSDKVKKDFYNTYITENRYLKPFEESSEESGNEDENFAGGKRNYDILQLKVEFQENSTALSATDVNILRFFVYTAQSDPTKGVQITIGQESMNDVNKKKLTARRLAIVNAIFKEEGLSDAQIIPILTDRDMESFAFSIIPIDKMENYRKGGAEKDMFGDAIGSSQNFRTMKW